MAANGKIEQEMKMEVPWIAPRPSTLESAHGELRAMTVELGGVPRGAVVVLCGRDRLSGHADVIMNRLAAQGYESVAVEADYRGPVAGWEQHALVCVRSAVQHLGRRGWEPEQVAVVGYQGFAAEAALVAATAIGLGAAVSVAPPWTTGGQEFRSHWAVGRIGALLAPWLGLVAEGVPTRDAAHPPGDPRSGLGAALAARAEVFTQLVVYPAVDDDFYLGSDRAAANEAAAQEAAFDGWQRTAEWLNLRVVPRLTPLAQVWKHTHPATPRPELAPEHHGRMLSTAGK